MTDLPSKDTAQPAPSVILSPGLPAVTCWLALTSSVKVALAPAVYGGHVPANTGGPQPREPQCPAKFEEPENLTVTTVFMQASRLPAIAKPSLCQEPWSQGAHSEC